MEKKRFPRLQSDFYREQYRHAVWLLLVLSVLAIVLTGFISWEILLKKSPVSYYAATISGRVIPMKAEGTSG